MKETNLTGCYPKCTDWLHLNHSRCPTNCRSGVIDPSLERCDSPLQEEPTLPSLEQPTMTGTPLEIDQTLNFNPFTDFDQGAGTLARLGFGGANVFLEAVSLLFPRTPTPPISFDSFLSCPTSYSASQKENLKKSPRWHFSSRVPNPRPVLDSAEPMFF